MPNTLTVYKASAGSGKTFTLAMQYIALLVSSDDPCEYRHILAVTFTNKATAEMKDRIIGQLYGIAYDLRESDAYLAAVHATLRERNADMNDDILRQKAKRALIGILHDYSRFRVETIDSFFQSILRSLAHELGLNANMQVGLNTKELINKAVDRLIDTLSDGRDELKTWILEYVGSQLDENKDWDIRHSVKELAQCIFQEEYQHRDEAKRQALNDAEKIKAFRNAMHAIPRQIQSSMEELATSVITLVEGLTVNYDRISYGNSWRNYVLKIAHMETGLAMSDRMQKAIEDSSLILKSADRKNDDLLQEAELIAESYRTLQEKYDQLQQRFCTARLAVRYINELRLLGCIEAYCSEIANENNQFTLSKTPALLSQLIKDSDTPFVYEKAGITFRHIMIDEFQDTSRMQWDNFRVLLLENASKGGHDLVVGDIKQSIYRWRNGDWKILHGIRQQMNLPESSIRALQFNRRSAVRVVRFNNEFFRMAAAALDGVEGNQGLLSSIYSDVEQFTPDNAPEDEGCVRLHLYADGDLSRDEYETEVAKDMIAQIRQLQEKGQQLSEMAILVRTHLIAARLIERFRQLECNIPLISDEAFLLSASTAVQMIIAALRVLADRQHNSPVDMHFINQTYRRIVMGEKVQADDLYLSAQHLSNPLSELLQTRDEAHVADYDNLVQEPLYLLCEHLHRLFHLEKLPGQSAYMMAFMDEVQAYLQSGPADITAFLQAWDEDICRHSIPSSQMDGIRIVSIHQSKGLEYPTVFVPAMEWAIERDRTDDTLWCETHTDEFDVLGSLPIRTCREMSFSLYQEDYDNEHLQRRIDALNIMYVAFTRASCNLMVWGRYHKATTLPRTNADGTLRWNGCLNRSAYSGDLLSLFIQLESGDAPEEHEVLMQSGLPIARRASNGGNRVEEVNRMTPSMPTREQTFTSIQPSMQFLSSNASRRFLSELHSSDGKARQEAWEVGIIVHRILGMIHTQKDIPHALQECQRNGLVADEEMAKRIVKRLKQGFTNAHVQSWFSNDCTLFNECTIAARDEKTGQPIIRRPDRVVMSDSIIHVVDYKLGRHHPEYLQQVEQYVRLMQQMYPNHNVQGWLWYIMKGEVVKVESTD